MRTKWLKDKVAEGLIFHSYLLTYYYYILVLLHWCFIHISLFQPKYLSECRELKGLMRSVGDIQFVRIHSDGSAIAKFNSSGDMLNAIAELDGSRYKGCRLTVMEEVCFCFSLSWWLRIKERETESPLAIVLSWWSTTLYSIAIILKNR